MTELHKQMLLTAGGSGRFNGLTALTASPRMLPSTAQAQTRRSALHDSKRLPSSATIVRGPGMYDQRFELAIAHLTGLTFVLYGV